MCALIRQRAWPLLACLTLIALQTGFALPASADPTSESTTRFARVLNGGAPRSLAELKEIQRRIQLLTDKILPATVAIQVGRANGSGVIIDAEGHVLTAAHVAGHPGRRATMFLSDGRSVNGVTLGLNQQLDSGLIQITDRGPWPYAPMGKSADVKDGQWCVATGHPGGYDANRPPVLRWGRVLRTVDYAILTDCTLVGGDSGGPLFDLEGHVIGVHSRIGKNLTVNVHVPIDQYSQSWDRLVEGEMWGLLAEHEADAPELSVDPGSSAQESAWLGVVNDRESRDPRAIISRVEANSPAERAGLQAGDIVLRIEDTKIDSFESLQAEIRLRRPGDRVLMEVRRNNAVLPLHVQLGARLNKSRP